MILFIKDFGIIIGCIFFFVHLLHLKPTKQNIKGAVIFLAVSMFLMPYFEQTHPQFVPALLPAGAILLTIFFRIDYDTTLNTLLLSFAFSYVFFMIAIIPVSLVHVLTGSPFSDIMLQTAALLIQWCLMPLPFCFERTKKGMPFLRNKTYSLPCMIISLLIIAFSLLLNGNPQLIIIKLCYLALIPILLLIYYYWRKYITKTYIDKLNNNNILALNNELFQKEEQIKKLTQDNEQLSALIHKDNKLIPAMEYAVEQYLSQAVASASTLETGNRLLTELRQLASERKGLLTEHEQILHPLPDTGNDRANHLLSYLQQKAFSQNITLQVIVEHPCTTFFKHSLSEDSFCTLLADLVENALIATKCNNGKHVLVDIGTINQLPALHIFDTGVPISTDVLLKYGKEAITTHGDDNGSGIGLMQTAALLNTHNGSLYIEEFVSGQYTKKISVVFDSHHSYTLCTYRDESELLPLKKRPDIFVVQK